MLSLYIYICFIFVVVVLCCIVLCRVVLACLVLCGGDLFGVCLCCVDSRSRGCWVCVAWCVVLFLFLDVCLACLARWCCALCSIVLSLS